MLKWDLYRSLLAYYERGTLIGAAKNLNCEHSTVGRQIKQLEAQLQTKLRNEAGITEEALTLIPKLKEVERLIEDIQKGKTNE